MTSHYCYITFAFFIYPATVMSVCVSSQTRIFPTWRKLQTTSLSCCYQLLQSCKWEEGSNTTLSSIRQQHYKFLNHFMWEIKLQIIIKRRKQFDGIFWKKLIFFLPFSFFNDKHFSFSINFFVQIPFSILYRTS